jgi:tRNA dimethylallyltransferase
MTFNALFIAGPTASGKSALAMQIAQLLPSSIINADSMQVYSDLSVITARPTVQEMGDVPHHLFGTIDGAQNYSVGSYIKDALKIDNGRFKIFVGGTGLYYKTLLEGLSDMPKVPDDIRNTMRALPLESLHEALGAVDKLSYAALNPNDSVRILRALEIYHTTGISIVEWRKLNPPKPFLTNVLKIFVNPPRDVVYNAINNRYVKMLEMGALQEVETLMKRNLDPALPVMRAHGVPSLIKYLHNEMTRDEAIEIGQVDTRHYAKRQWTWFRNQMQAWTSVTPENALNTVREQLEC